LDEARERLHAVWADARDRGDESDLAFVLVWLSWLEIRRGDLTAAASVAEEAISLATLTGAGSLHTFALAQRALVHAHQGAVEETRGICAKAASAVEHA